MCSGGMGYGAAQGNPGIWYVRGYIVGVAVECGCKGGGG